MASSSTHTPFLQTVRTQALTMLDEFAALDNNTQFVVLGVAACMVTAITTILGYFLLQVWRKPRSVTPTTIAPPVNKPATNVPITSIKIPATVFKDHGMVLSRPGSSTSLLGIAAATTGGSAHTSPRNSPATSPESPSTPSRKGFLSRVGARKRGDSFLLGGGDGSGRRRVDSQNPSSPLVRRSTIPDAVDDNVDTDLRVSVAPWLVQDDKLARPLEVFVDGETSRVSEGEKLYSDINPKLDEEETRKMKLRASVAPWLVQAEAPDDGEGDVDDVTGEAPSERVRSGSVIGVVARKVLSPILGPARKRSQSDLGS